MTDAETKKVEISSLWGIPIEQIDEKLNTLKAVITDSTDYSLLELLLRCDLNIETAIRRYFSGNTPSPPPQSYHQIHQNHHDATTSNMELKVDHHTESEDDEPSLSPSNRSVAGIPSSNNRSFQSRLRCKRRSRLVYSPEDSIADNTSITEDHEETEDSLPILRRSPSPTITHRKRNKTDSTSTDSEEDDESENEPIRPRKRRKLSPSERRRMNRMNELSHSTTHNTNYNNSNNNNSNSNNTNHNDSNISSQSDSEPANGSLSAVAAVDQEWTQKKMGTVFVKYVDHFGGLRNYDLNITTITELIAKESSQDIEIISSSPMERHVLYEAVKRYHIRKMESEEHQRKHWWKMSKFERRLRRCTQFKPTPEVGVVAQLNPKKPKMVEDGKTYTYSTYTVEIDITFNRRSPSTTEFIINSPLLVAAFSHSDELKTETLKCRNVFDEYEQKEHSFSMASLLDLSCRYSYDTNDWSDNYNHGLNVTLHQYQLQSLQWMMEEENHPIGFYRHLYYEGRFGDDAPFIFSPVFNRLIFSGAIPVAHGGLLCEEMGLGKTIISLALIHAQKPRDLRGYSTKRNLVVSHSERVSGWKEDPNNPRRNVRYHTVNKWYKSAATLIIAPCSLVGQWESECDKRCDGRLKWKRYHGSNRSRKIQDYIDSDIVLTTYGIIAGERGEGILLEKHVLQQIEWNRIILDESHSIKSKQSECSKSIPNLRAKNRWCLTGTPFGTKVLDLENQLRFIGLRPEDIRILKLSLLSSRNVFQPDSVKNVRQRMDKIVDQQDAKPLVSLIGRLIMRHKKDQKFNDQAIVSMPDKEENEIFIDFNLVQRVYYDKLYKSAKERYDYFASMSSVSRASLQILSALHPARSACSGFVCSKDEIEMKLSAAEAQSFRVRSMVLSMADQNVSSKDLFAMAAEEAFADRDGECPICFECPLDDPLQTPCRHLFCRECILSSLRLKSECPMCRSRVHPRDLKQPKTESSDGDEVQDTERKHGHDTEDDDDIIRFDAKINRLMAELTKIKRDRPNEKSLIFTSFSKSLDWICSELGRNGFSYRTLTGKMTIKKRKEQLAQFANDGNVDVFVLTVRAGAVGITLTAANHVFMMEPTLNPALHRQAINRVYRLGQKRKVFIRTMIMRDSIEERIWNVIHKGNGRRRNEDEQQEGSQEDATILQSRARNIAGNIRNDRLDSNIIDRLFQ